MSQRLSFVMLRLVLMLLLLLLNAPLSLASPTLNTRLSNLEANWSHLRLGGEFVLRSDIYHGKPFEFGQTDGSDFLPGVRQDMKVFLDAQASPEFGAQIALTHQGFWGVSSPSDGNMDKPPLIAPFILDEAAIRLRKPQFLGDGGRFRFTLDPMGLITDHTSYPIEGIALQTTLKGVYLGGYYSRLSSMYQPGNLYVRNVDDELALRVALPRPTYLLGFTLVPSGLSRDSAWAIDYTGWLGQRGLQVTLANYTPSPDNYLEYVHDGAWGFLANIDLIPGDRRSLSMKMGYFQLGFTPTFSRLSHAVVGEGEPFGPNQKGVSFLYRQALTPLWEFTSEVTINAPLEYIPDLMTEGGRKTMTDWEVKAIRRFSPNAFVELGYESDQTAIGRYGLLTASINLRF